jgi:hypothetical protein
LYYKYGPGLAEEAKEYPALMSVLRGGLDVFVDWLEVEDRRDSIGAKAINQLVKLTDKILSIFTDENDYVEDEEEPVKSLLMIPKSQLAGR